MMPFCPVALAYWMRQYNKDTEERVRSISASCHSLAVFQAIVDGLEV